MARSKAALVASMLVLVGCQVVLGLERLEYDEPTTPASDGGGVRTLADGATVPCTVGTPGCSPITGSPAGDAGAGCNGAACACTPDCTDRCGGADGCGGVCPSTCPANAICGGGGTPNRCGCGTPLVQGWNYPGEATDSSFVGMVRWEFPNDATSEDQRAAAVTVDPSGANPTSHFLMLRDFRFSIPEAASISGIVVAVSRSELAPSSSIIDHSVRLLRQSAVFGDDRASTALWPPGANVAIYGSSSDIWAGAWRAIEINDFAFGVALSVRGTGTARVEVVKVQVHYTIPCR